METLEELERRKRELELRRDIARMERQERIISKLDPALLWAAPLIVIASFIAFMIIDDSGIKTLPSAILGILIGMSLLGIFRRIRRRQRVGPNRERDLG